MSPEYSVEQPPSSEQEAPDSRTKEDILLAKLAREEDAMEIGAREACAGMTDAQLEANRIGAEANFSEEDREAVRGFDATRTDILGMHDRIDLEVQGVETADLSDKLGIKNLAELGQDLQGLVLERLTAHKADKLAEEHYPVPVDSTTDDDIDNRQRLAALLKMPSDKFYGLYNRWSDLVIVDDELADRESEAVKKQSAIRTIAVTDGSAVEAVDPSKPVAGGVGELERMLTIENPTGTEYEPSFTEGLQAHWQRFKEQASDPSRLAAGWLGKLAALRYNRQRSKEADSSNPGVEWRTKLNNQIGRIAALVASAEQAVVPVIKEGLSDFKDGLLHPNDTMLRLITEAKVEGVNIFSKLAAAREKMLNTGETNNKIARKYKIGVAALGFAAAGTGAYLAYRGFSGSGGDSVTKHFNESVGGGSLPVPRGGDSISPVGAHEISQTFSSEARLARPGEGWYRTIQQVTGIDNPKYQQNILNDIGPDLSRLGDAYRMDSGQWGITRPGKLSTRSLELIAKAAKARNYLK